MKFLNEVNINTGSQSEQVIESWRVDQSKSSSRQSKSQPTSDRINEPEAQQDEEEVEMQS
jgi:hypothetical protein